MYEGARITFVACSQWLESMAKKSELIKGQSITHIPNAINIANESIGTDEIPELPDKNQLIMVYCRSGRRSKEASEKLVKLGYTNIVEFGGILDWKGEIITSQ